MVFRGICDSIPFFVPPKISSSIPRPSQLAIQDYSLRFFNGNRIKNINSKLQKQHNNIPSRSISISGPFYEYAITNINYDNEKINYKNSNFERIEISENQNLLDDSNSSSQNKNVEQPPTYEVFF